MNVKINNVLYEDVSWTGQSMSMETDMTLAQIEAAFIPGTDSDIIVYDNDKEVARYYNKGIDSIVVKGNDPRIVEVVFHLTKIDSSDEEEIRESIETSDGAIAELAELVAGLVEEQEDLDAYNRLLALENWRGVMMQDDSEKGVIASIIARIEALEEKEGSAE